MSFIPPDFADFIAPDADRRRFIAEKLESLGIDYAFIPMEDSVHIYVKFPPSAYDPTFRIKTILVHYDRAENSPGANDNSAAIFQVFELLKKLKNFKGAHNMRIFFTDGEEMGALGGVADQGAFGIASRFKKLGIVNDDVFAVDSTGVGDVLVVSTTGTKAPGSVAFKKRFYDLYERTISLAKQVSPQKWVTCPVTYSDNAAFIASGIPAVAVTVLPKEEVSALMRRVQRDKNFEKALLDHSLPSTDLLPITWRYMHTPFDTAETLTAEAFALMEKFLLALAENKTLAI